MGRFVVTTPGYSSGSRTLWMQAPRTVRHPYGYQLWVGVSNAEIRFSSSPPTVHFIVPRDISWKPLAAVFYRSGVCTPSEV